MVAQGGGDGVGKTSKGEEERKKREKRRGDRGDGERREEGRRSNAWEITQRQKE